MTRSKSRAAFSSRSIRCMVDSSSTRWARAWSVMVYRRAFSMATAAWPAKATSRSDSLCRKGVPSRWLIASITPITRSRLIIGTHRMLRVVIPVSLSTSRFQRASAMHVVDDLCLSALRHVAGDPDAQGWWRPISTWLPPASPVPLSPRLASPRFHAGTPRATWKTRSPDSSSSRSSDPASTSRISTTLFMIRFSTLSRSSVELIVWLTSFSVASSVARAFISWYSPIRSMAAAAWSAMASMTWICSGV